MGNAERRNCFGETEVEEEARRKAGERKRGIGVGRGKEKPPWRPLGIGDLKVVPHECWHEDSETGVPKCSPKSKYGTGGNHFVHVTLEGYAQDLRDSQAEIPTPEDILIKKEEDEDDQEWREEKRHDPKAMLTAAKSLLCMLYGGADDSVSMEEFESIATHSIIALYLRERMDGVVKYFFKNLRDEYITEMILEFVKKMATYKPSVSEEEVNHILPHARIEEHEQDAVMRKIQRAGISSQAKARLISRAQQEQSRSGCRGANPNDNCYAIRLGKELFGKDRFGRMLRA